MNQTTAKYLIGFGVLVVLIGIVVYFFSEKLQWLGKLPGDIRYEGKNTKIYFPITTMILNSLVINGLIYLVRKFFN